MLLPLNSFTVLVEQMAAAVQGGASQLVDVSVGSVLRAVIEAGASLALWMQWLILQVVSLTRASTSNGADLDSWMADFSLTRLPGAAAAGTVTFARYTVGLNTVVPVGTIVRTDDGSQSFIVVASSSDAAWNGLNGYDLPAALASIDVPVQAVVTGSLGNVVSNAIGLLSTAIPGVDTVGNANALIGGVDPESGSALLDPLSILYQQPITCDAAGDWKCHRFGEAGFAVWSLRERRRFRCPLSWPLHCYS